MESDDREERFSRLLGRAAVALWSRLPQDVQHDLFEEAVLTGHEGEPDESLRETLATFLHERHVRTAVA